MNIIYWFYRQRYTLHSYPNDTRLFLKINKNIPMKQLGSSYKIYNQHYYIGVYVPQ